MFNHSNIRLPDITIDVFLPYKTYMPASSALRQSESDRMSCRVWWSVAFSASALSRSCGGLFVVLLSTCT